MIDHRALAIQNDPNQLRSLHEFTESLIRELNTLEGIPSKALMRELLTQGIQHALIMSGTDYKRRFLDSLAGNIHKFPLQEQQSLARVHPVEISSEYRNLASFGAFAEDVQQDVDDDVVIIDEPTVSMGSASQRPGSLPPSATGVAAAKIYSEAASSTLEDARRDLAFLPATPGVAAEEVAQRLLDEDVARALRETSPQGRAAFFSDLRLNLFKLSESQQQALVDKFQELRADVVRLVESMTQEISKWLDEEKVAVQREPTGPLMTKLRALFKATLSVPFQATFKHMKGGPEKRGKEAFLLKIALCLRTCLDKRFVEHPELGEQVSQLRRQFFYVDGYGELMEDWLQNRIRQLNEDFTQRAAAVMGRSLSTVQGQLRQTLRPGRWLVLNDVRLEEDLFRLFLDESFPRHVITMDSIRNVLKKVFEFGGDDFHVYGDIVRLAAQRLAYAGSSPQSAMEKDLLEVLKRFPAFPALRRIRPGLYWFGRIEVEFAYQYSAAGLLARGRRNGQPLREMQADEFFRAFGPEEFPAAAATAVQASLRDNNGPPSTSIEDNNLTLDIDLDGPQQLPAPALQPKLPLQGGPLSLPSLLPPPPLKMTGAMPLASGPGLSSLHPPHVQQSRFQPYPTVQRFGLEDDEI